jgi:hypothetical protein
VRDKLYSAAVAVVTGTLRRTLPEGLWRGVLRRGAPELGASYFDDYPYSLRPRALAETAGGRQLTARFEAALASTAALDAAIAAHAAQLRAITVHRTAGLAVAAPIWKNGWLPSVDGATLYALLATRKPRLYLEIGSGNSTRFARRAIADLGLGTRIVSIDPQPRAEIDAICDEVIRRPLEAVAPSVFGELGAGDVVFFDGSHRSFANSDVTVFFTEILPAIPSGVVWGLHDIVLPDDYPVDGCAYYNEQYLLASYLLGGAGSDEIVFPAYFASTRGRLPLTAALFAEPELREAGAYGCGFWMQRR